MLAFVLAAIVAQAPTTSTATPTVAKASGKRSVLVLDMKASGVDPATTQTISEIVANAFAREPTLSVTSGADVRAVMDVEANKRALDCGEAQSCLAEIAGALGADLVVTGSVGKLGDLLVVTISVYDAKAQAGVAKRKIEDTDMAKLSPKIDDAVANIAGGITGAHTAVDAGGGGGGGMFTAGLVTTGAGVILLVVGGVAVGYGSVVLSDPTSSGADKDAANAAYVGGIVGGAVGALATAAGVVMIVLAE